MGYNDNYFRMVSEMLQKNKMSIQSTGYIIWHLPRKVWLVITNDQKRLCMNLREDIQIQDTPEGTHNISGSNK